MYSGIGDWEGTLEMLYTNSIILQIRNKKSVVAESPNEYSPSTSIKHPDNYSTILLMVY